MTTQANSDFMAGIEVGRREGKQEAKEEFEKMIDGCENIGAEGDDYLIDKAELKAKLQEKK